MYTVETDGQAQQQVDALPGDLRVHTFGAGRGLAVYLILDDQRCVDVLQVQWGDLPR